MNTRKREALQNMVKTKNGKHLSGTTVAERSRAAEALSRGSLRPEGTGNLARVEPETDFGTWMAQGMLIHTIGTTKRYVQQNAMEHFLAHVPEGEMFTYHSIPFVNGVFGTGDFYVIKNWLLSLKLIHKVAGGWLIDSIASIKQAWNNLVVSAMKLA